VLKVSGTTQNGNAGVIVNRGLMTVNGGLLDLENPTSGTGHVQIDGNGTAKLGNSFGDGGTITINAGTLEFGPVVVSLSPGFATNPGMHFLGGISFAAGSDPTFQSAVEGLKIDGAWHVGAALTVALSNIQPGIAELTVSDGVTKLADVKLLGHYDQTEFAVGHVGADVTVAFHQHALTAAIPHS
jgi:hypothetical protein